MYQKDNDDAFVKQNNDPKPQFTKGTGDKKPEKLSLSEMMKMANEHPDATFDI